MSSSTTSSIWTSRSSRTASSRRPSMKSPPKGVSYFSSAGNRPATQAYDSKLRIVPGSRLRPGPARTSTSRNVPPDAVCRRLPRLRRGQRRRHRADHPVRRRQHARVPVERAVRPAAADAGRSRRSLRAWARCRRAATTSFTFNGTAGQLVEIFVDADNTTTGTPNPDLTFALFDPNGNADPVRRYDHQSGVADPGAAAHRHVHGRRRQLRGGAVRRLSCIACSR